MRFLTRLALNFFASWGGISPILTIGNDLPGDYTQAQLDPATLESLWVNLNKEDFPQAGYLTEIMEGPIDKIKWGQVSEDLYKLIEDTSLQGYRRVSLLINMAVANYFLKRYNWVKPSLDEAEKIANDLQITAPHLRGRIDLAKTILIKPKSN